MMTTRLLHICSLNIAFVDASVELTKMIFNKKRKECCPHSALPFSAFCETKFAHFCLPLLLWEVVTDHLNQIRKVAKTRPGERH